MTFSESWHTLLDKLHNLPEEAILTTPLSQKRFSITDTQERAVVVEFLDHDIDQSHSLRRDQFETLYRRATEELSGFSLDRLPPNAEPYASVLSLHPHLTIDVDEWILGETEIQSPSPVVEVPTADVAGNQQEADTEPSIEEMIDNMGEPPKRVVCPIDGCQYSHRSASSVARHVSGSSTDKHIWENTEYAGWRDFVRKHG